MHVNALNYIGSSSKLMAVYQALTLRLNPLKMDQIRKRRTSLKHEGGDWQRSRSLPAMHEIQIRLSIYTHASFRNMFYYFKNNLDLLGTFIEKI